MTDAIDIEARKTQLLIRLEKYPSLGGITIFLFTQACLFKSKTISEIKSVILETVKQNSDLVFSIIDGFTQACLDKNIPIQDSENPKNDIRSVILKAVKQNPYLVFGIIDGFTQACLVKAQSISDIQPVILDAVKQNPDLVFNIIDGFTQACLDKNIPIQDSKNPENDIQPVILTTLQTDAVKQNPNLAFKIINGFTQVCLVKGKSISEIKSVILETVKQNQNLAFDIINGFTKACLSQGKTISEIKSVILETVKQNSDLVFSIIDGFTQACLDKNIPIQNSENPENDIQSVISLALQIYAIKQNPNLVFDIIDGFTKACLSQGKTISEIQSVILTTLQTEAVKQNPYLVFDIINAFTRCCLFEGKIKESIPVFQNLLEEVQKPEFSVKNKTLLINQIKSFSILILSTYLQDTLLTLKDESSLSKKDKDISVENELLGLFKSLYSEVFKDIKTFEDIKLKDLIPIWQIFFVSKIKTQTIDGGKLYEILPFIFDIFKGQDLTINQFIEQTKALLQNFYYINLNCEGGKEQLKKIKEESEKPENKDKPFIVYAIFPDHAAISIIQNGQISIIDSSHIIFHPERPQHQQILRECGFEIDDEKEDELYFNTTPYQENGTCYLNAALAFKCIMEKLLSQQKDKKPEDTSTTLNSIISYLKKETDIELTQSDNTIKLQQIVVNVVSQSAKFYETLQQLITKRYITDVKVLEKDASVKPLTSEAEFTDPEKTTSSSSLTSEEAVADREKEKLQGQLILGTITENKLAIKPQIIATIIANASIVSRLAAISTIFGAIQKVQKNVAVIQKDQQGAAKSQITSQGTAVII